MPQQGRRRQKFLELSKSMIAVQIPRQTLPPMDTTLFVPYGLAELSRACSSKARVRRLRVSTQRLGVMVRRDM